VPHHIYICTLAEAEPNILLTGSNAGLQNVATHRSLLRWLPVFGEHFAVESKTTIVSTTELNSDVPVPYIDAGIIHRLYGTKRANEVSESWSRRRLTNRTAAAFISNCGPKKRLRLLEELMRAGVEMDSFGRCLHNADGEVLDTGSTSMHTGKNKLHLLEGYLFAIAFENSEANDYVTEKFYQALEAGAVPVIIGPANIAAFAPSKLSFLNANDYSSPIELANEMLAIGQSKRRWGVAAADWRKPQLGTDIASLDARHGFVRMATLASMAATHSDCRRCIWIADAERLRRCVPIRTVVFERCRASLSTASMIISSGVAAAFDDGIVCTVP
jgi:hypothetical protein